MITTTTTYNTDEIFQCTGYSEFHSKHFIRSNPVYHFPKDRKYITFTSREEDEMKSHDLTNLVSARLEEERTSTAAPLKL